MTSLVYSFIALFMGSYLFAQEFRCPSGQLGEILPESLSITTPEGDIAVRLNNRMTSMLIARLCRATGEGEWTQATPSTSLGGPDAAIGFTVTIAGRETEVKLLVWNESEAHYLINGNRYFVNFTFGLVVKEWVDQAEELKAKTD